MIRNKIILGKYTYIIEYYDAMESLTDEEHYDTFYLFKNQDFISETTIDKDIYIISEKNFYNKNFIFPLPHGVSTGYSLNCKEFNPDLKSDTLNNQKYKLCDNNGESKSIICDKVRIYFPTINPNLNAIIDVENYINDIKIHYFIDLTNNYERHCDNEFKFENNTYSEYIEFYMPSLNNLLYNKDIYIKEYNVCSIKGSNEPLNNEENLLVPFYITYYPFEIKKEINDDGSINIEKIFNIKSAFINSNFFNTLNIILYPYIGFDNSNIYIVDTTLNYNSNTFNLNLFFNLQSEIRFPFPNEIENDLDKYYGIPCIISNFKYPKYFNIDNNLNEKDKCEESYLLFTGYDKDDYIEFNDEKDVDDEFFGEELNDIKTTGFFIEMSTDKLFKDSFYKKCMNLNPSEYIIDNLIFPLNIFNSWDDVPELILYRITFIDKLACLKIKSNPVIITKEWYKYLINETNKFKLKFSTVYKFSKNIEGDMELKTLTEDNLLFIDKINCSIKRSNENENTLEVLKKNSPKIIYKPIFYKTADLQNINLISGIPQNIGVNLNEYLSKVETFKLIIEQKEYIEIGRNDIYVIFLIDPNKISNTSGKYIITNENNDYISNGNYYIN